MKKHQLIILFLMIFFFAACEEDSWFNFNKKDSRGIERGDIIEVDTSGHLNKSEINERIDLFPSTDFAEYGVTYLSITYRTEYMGDSINASGLLVIPDGIDSVDLIMYCHGTEIPGDSLGANKITPSYYKGDKSTNRDARNMGLGWASKGYVVFMPDYIGFGITDSVEHPYMYYPEMFISNIDGLLAAKSYLIGKGYQYDNQLFIAGWSLGGGACLSAHKYIQEQYASEFTVEASSSLAGVLNYEKYLLSNLEYKDNYILIMSIISWSVYGVNNFSSLQRPVDEIYSVPIANQIASIYVPSYKPSDIFQPDFISGILDGTDTEFLDVISQNSYSSGWKPVGKVFLHHGDFDNVVPYFNSEDAKTGLEAEGGDVTLYTYPGGTHSSKAGEFILKTLEDFNQLR